MQILDWQYLIFLLPIALGALYVLLMAVGMFGSEGDADVSAGHDAGVDHGDITASHGDIAHGDVAHGEVGHAHLEHACVGHHVHLSIFDALLGFLGFGKAPMSILMMSYCFVWGGMGLAGLTLFGESAIWRAAGIAGVTTVIGTRYLAIGLARLIPSVESYHTPLADLEGLTGEVLYAITEDSGTVRVRDQQHNLRDVPCRVARGEKSIPAGSKVVLFYYNPATKTFVVAP